MIKGKDLEKYKKRLIELKKQLIQSVQAAKDDVKSQEKIKGYSQHQADEGTDDFGRMVSLALSNKESYVIRQIDRALEKIEEGTYGICDLTGEEIPIKRLNAIPYATVTVAAQEKLEKGLIE
ncbi:MAG: molecular chaperone DnaK [Chlamydiae bacterium SM23_39]|nr:MAG: molecular chaperone DnaK [Chlamydiae bacterium SM23_39]